MLLLSCVSGVLFSVGVCVCVCDLLSFLGLTLYDSLCALCAYVGNTLSDEKRVKG